MNKLFLGSLSKILKAFPYEDGFGNGDGYGYGYGNGAGYGYGDGAEYGDGYGDGGGYGAGYGYEYEPITKTPNKEQFQNAGTYIYE